jgi:hypothetical protein
MPVTVSRTRNQPFGGKTGVMGRDATAVGSTWANRLEEKRPEGRSRHHSGGPEGNRTPDLFHAKNEIGGRPFLAISAAISNGHYKSPIGGLLVA